MSGGDERNEGLRPVSQGQWPEVDRRRVKDDRRSPIGERRHDVGAAVGGAELSDTQWAKVEALNSRLVVFDVVIVMLCLGIISYVSWLGLVYFEPLGGFLGAALGAMALTMAFKFGTKNNS